VAEDVYPLRGIASPSVVSHSSLLHLEGPLSWSACESPGKRLISAIVLAAGKSERMGRPKALLPFRGRTFLENILDAISESSIKNTIIVIGHHRADITARLNLPNLIFNADYEQGMVTSFQTGIRALPRDCAGAVLFLVDHPVVEPVTIDALVQSFAPNRIVVPVFNGRRGHPVLFAAEVLQEILALPSSQGANIVVRKDPGRIVEVAVDSPGILVDVDTPEDFEKL
jgi:molybdenum cofactor cytidylyltransferase